jgi:hypothetical protein
MTQQAMCGSVRYRDAETTVPACHIRMTQTLQDLHVEMSSNSLFRRNELKAHQSPINSLTAPRMSVALMLAKANIFRNALQVF